MNRSVKILSAVLILILISAVVLSLTTNFRFGNIMDDQRKLRMQHNWHSFQNDRFDFTFQYPPEALVDISDPPAEDAHKRVRVRLTGPESEPATEITDGFTFYVRSADRKQQESFSDTANRIFRAETQNREITHPINQAGVSDRNAYSFRIRSELGGEVMYEIIEADESSVFVTQSIISVPKDQERDYADIIEKMQLSQHLP